MKSGSVVSVLVCALALGACSGTGARSDPPDVVDDWQLPAGAEVDSNRLYRENLHLFDYDTGAPLDIRQVGTERIETVAASDLTFASPKGGRVPATMFVPDGEGPFGGVVLMHGLPSNREAMSDQAIAYAMMGAVVITIDAPFARPENAGREPLVLTEQDRDEQIQLIVDLRRAVDILLLQPEVDAQRTAYVGFSYGAAMGGLLSGVEARLMAYVLVVGDGGLVTHLTGPEDRDSYFFGLPANRREAWLAAMWPVEPIHYVAHAAPAALLFQNGTEDDLVPPADGLRYQEAGSEPKTMLWYRAGHGQSQQATDDALAWLRNRGILGQSRGRVLALWIDRGLLVWSALTLAALIFLMWALGRDRIEHAGTKLIWALAVIFFGPLGLLAYVYLYRRKTPTPGSAFSDPERALGSTIWSAAGNLLGVAVIALASAYQPLLVYLVPLGTGFIVYQLSRLPKRDPALVTHAQPLVVQILSTNMILVGVLVLLPFALEYLDRLYFGVPIQAVWAVLVLGSVAAVLTGYPIHRWMVGRGLVQWGPDVGVAKPTARRLSTYRAVGLALSTFVVLVALVSAASNLAG